MKSSTLTLGNSNNSLDKMNAKRVVIYARVSSMTDRQSTDRQVADLTTYAEKEGLQVVRVFEEHASGAKKIEERAILAECLDYCTSNNIHELLVSELSRLGRSTLQVLRSIELLHNAHVGVFVQNIGIHTLQDDGTVNPIASILVTVLSEVASIERSNIQYRLNSGLQVYKAHGGKVGRRKGSIKSRETKQKEYKEVINYLRRGYSLRDVARLCDVGISTVQRVKKDFL